MKPALLSCLLRACFNSRHLEPRGPESAGQFIDLTEACSGPWVVVFFYPEADTPG